MRLSPWHFVEEIPLSEDSTTSWQTLFWNATTLRQVTTTAAATTTILTTSVVMSDARWTQLTDDRQSQHTRSMKTPTEQRNRVFARSSKRLANFQQRYSKYTCWLLDVCWIVWTLYNWTELTRFSFSRTDQWASRASSLVINWRVREHSHVAHWRR